MTYKTDNNQISPATAAVAGIAIGVAAAVAGALILNNKTVVTSVKKNISEGADSLEGAVEKAVEATKEAIKS